MKKFPLAILFGALLSGVPAFAQTVATDPVGAVNITIKGNSDTIVAVPLTPNPDYSGAVSTVASGGTNLFNLNVTGTTGWTSNQFANLYYVRMTSGAKNGMYYTITANSASQLTVDTAGDNLSGVVAGDTFKVLKYWTLGTLFPPASAGTATNPLTASTGLASPQRRSQIILPNNSAVGINLAASGIYFFTTSGWFATNTGNPPSDNVILLPDSYFVVRQPAVVIADATWTSVGSVITTKVSIPLATQAAGKQDNYVGLGRPVDIRVADSGLETGFLDSTGLASPQRRDLLLIFDNATASFNKAAAKTLFRYNGNWYQTTTGNPLADDELLAAGTGVIVRKYQDANSATALWANSPSY